jgi:type 1 glutamine amidotransferase
LRDLKDPTATIHPDYVGYNVSLPEGEELSGFVRAQSEAALRIVGVDGKERVVPRKDAVLRPSSVSLMPAGLIDSLNGSQVNDLLLFLLSSPPARTAAEISQLTSTASGATESDAGSGLLRVILVASKQDHGAGQHDYPRWQTDWVALLNRGNDVKAEAAWEWPSAEQFENAQVIVFYYWNHDWSPNRYAQLDKFQGRGGGVVALHSATIADREPEALAERLGLSAQPVRSKYRHTPINLQITTGTDHPIMRGFGKQVQFLDETYWPLIGDPSKVDVLATAEEEGQQHPMIWTYRRGKGRVFASILGHYAWTYEDPLFRVMLLRGIGWASGGPASRLENLN